MRTFCPAQTDAPPDSFTYCLTDAMNRAVSSTYFTPVVTIDGVSLAFSGELEPGKEAELFATLLTHATFEVRNAEVVHEAYERAHARLDEERWYALAKEYFDEYKALVERSDARTRQAHLAWLDEHFFGRHPALRVLRESLVQFAARAGRPGLETGSEARSATNQEVRVLH